MSVLRQTVFMMIVLLWAVQVTGVQAAGNPARIEKAQFDTLTHRFVIEWNLDTTDVPPGCEGAVVALCGDDTLTSEPPDDQFPVSGLEGDTAVVIASLQFDTTYRVGLWLRIQGRWTAPDTGALVSVRVPKTTWEYVRLFSVPVSDTVSLFNGKMLLWRDGSFSSSVLLHTDTIRAHSIAVSKFKGFKGDGNGFVFSDPVSLPPFFVGFRTDSVQEVYTPCIFRDSSGYLRAEHQTVFDRDRHIVYCRTEQIDGAFVVLSDTTAPRVKMENDSGIVNGTRPFDCSFAISDNTANCRWQLFSGAPGEAPFTSGASFSGVLGDTAKRVSCQVPTEGALDGGLRLYMVVSDGTHHDTCNFSQSIRKTKCNEMTLPADMIMPIGPDAKLDSSSCRSALKTLFAKSGDRYAPADFRLYRWSSSSWREYSSDRAKEFAFGPGELFWLITRKETVLDFGNGRSPSLRDTVNMPLAKGTWTDFSSPFTFPVAFGDIVAATGSGGDSLHFCQWIRNKAKKTWNAVAVFDGAVEGLAAQSTTLGYGSSGFFTVYNSTGSDITLKIPPTACTDAGSLPKVKSTSAAQGWTVRFDLLQQGERTGSVVVGTHEGSSGIEIPAAPSFGENPVYVEEAGRRLGVLIRHMESSQPQNFDVVVVNAEAVPVTVECVPALVHGEVAGSAVAGNWTGSFLEPVALTLAAHERGTIHYTAGKAVADGSIALPATGTARILSLHIANREAYIRVVAPDGRFRLEMYSPSGRRLGTSGWYGGQGTAVAAIRFSSGNCAVGCCIVRLVAERADGSTEVVTKKVMAGAR